MTQQSATAKAVEALTNIPVKWMHGNPTQYMLDREDAEFIVESLTDQGFVLLKPDPAEPHVIEFRDDGWTIKHTLAERVDDDAVFDCDLANWRGGDPGVRGRFELRDDRTFGREVTP